MAKAYKVQRDVTIRGSVIYKNGDTVYPLAEYDQGAAQQATQMMGKPHVSVTRNANGKGSFFTVAEEDLTAIMLDDTPKR